jgi:hypothetical protein
MRTNLSFNFKVNRVSGMWPPCANPTRDAILFSLAPCKVELQSTPHGERDRGEGSYSSEVRQPFPILLNPRSVDACYVVYRSGSIRVWSNGFTPHPNPSPHAENFQGTLAWGEGGLPAPSASVPRGGCNPHPLPQHASLLVQELVDVIAALPMPCEFDLINRLTEPALADGGLDLRIRSHL